MAKLLSTCTGLREGLREDLHDTESKINFVLYDVILTFKEWGFPDVTFLNIFTVKTYKVLAYQKLCLMNIFR